MTQSKQKTDYNKMLKDMLQEWKWLLHYIRGYRWGIALYILIGTVSTLLGLGTGVASKHLIDAVVSYDKPGLVSAACFVISLAVFQILMNALSSRVSSLIGTKVHKELRSELYQHIINADWEGISRYHSGDLLNRLEGDINSVFSSVVSFLPGAVTGLVRFVGALCIVLYYDWVMAVIALIGSPVLAFTSRYMLKRIRSFSTESREQNSRILSFSTESIQNLQSVKAFDLPRQYISRFSELLDCYRMVRIGYDKFSILMTLLLSFIGLIVSYSCYGWGVWRLWNGAITYGTMTLFLQLSGILTASFSTLVSLVPGAVSIATSAGRVKELLEITPEPESNETDAITTGPVFLSAEHVSFQYQSGSKAVLSDACFYAAPGETIALVGPSGEGKTTTLRLLLGLLSPQSGKIMLRFSNGTEKTVSPSTRKYCSFVPQGGSLFSGTIADNLRLIKPAATDEEICSALKTADAWDFVSALPDSINTLVGEKGVNFSEGQGQRLAIARAVLRDAPLLLMDESTSALDMETEARVLARLMKAEQCRTIILTTHRPSMLRYCDRIYRITENGNVIQVPYSDFIN